MKIISYSIACLAITTCSINFGMTITEELLLGKEYSLQTVSNASDWLEIMPHRTHHRLFKRVTQQDNLEVSHYIEYDEKGEISNIDQVEKDVNPAQKRSHIEPTMIDGEKTSQIILKNSDSQLKLSKYIKPIAGIALVSFIFFETKKLHRSYAKKKQN